MGEVDRTDEKLFETGSWQRVCELCRNTDGRYRSRVHPKRPTTDIRVV